MEKGNLRCEANVSVRKIGETKFNNKVELKNLNSVRFMQKAIEYEIERQIAAHEAGEGVNQETRLWDEKNNRTRVMRSKEDAHDYRYFPEPDLQPLKVSSEFIEQVKSGNAGIAGRDARPFYRGITSFPTPTLRSLSRIKIWRNFMKQTAQSFGQSARLGELYPVGTFARIEQFGQNGGGFARFGGKSGGTDQNSGRRQNQQ